MMLAIPWVPWEAIRGYGLCPITSNVELNI